MPVCMLQAVLIFTVLTFGLFSESGEAMTRSPKDREEFCLSEPSTRKFSQPQLILPVTG